ncbi:MAG: MOSC domain-containing protein, partial [Flammeovirgaceae bacterium]
FIDNFVRFLEIPFKKVVSQRLKLSEIWIYPIKSLGGIRLPAAKVMEKGLEHDRRWMLIDANNTFLTQRTHHAMALFKLSIEACCFRIHHFSESISLPFTNEVLPEPISAKIWDDAVTVLEVNAELSHWFSKQLGIVCRLVQFPETNPRLIDEDYRIGNASVSLADGFPFLIIGQSSLNDLNQRLPQSLPMNRFRPNLVFAGGNPYEEDGWRNFLIGKNRFVGVKPCSRCVLTTIDQQTAAAGKEPLATLATYRKKDNKIYFGQNAIAIDYEEIFEGDEITIS